MDFRILGPLEARNDLGVVALGGTKPRAVLAVLLLNANQPVSSERLALALWGDDAPPGAARTVQVHVSRLRKALGDPHLIATTPAGYCLRLQPGELDAERFERLVEEGRRKLAVGHPGEAGGILREGLALWRGPPLADLAFEPFAQPEIAHLEEQRLEALESRVEADLAAGRHAALVGELQRLVSLHPTRERLAGALMIALYRCGRQAEALEAYREARQRLVAEVGVEPGPELRHVHDALLHQDVSLDPPVVVTELPAELDASLAAALAGREDELARLRDCWARARAGVGTLVALSGRSGIGKSRLAAELAGAVNGIGVTVLYASAAAGADPILATLRRAEEAAAPTLLVVEAVAKGGAELRRRLQHVADTRAERSLLVVATAETPEVLAWLAPDVSLVLEPLEADAVEAIARSYASAQGDVPVAWLLEASGGIPRRVHELAGQWARREAARRVGAVASEAAAGRVRLRSMEAELAGGVVDLQEARERVTLLDRDGAPVVCPFKGLASFQVGDAEYFFGRERLTAELVARLVGAPLLGVVGSSGSGKSSVVRAGLIPALAGGVLPGSEDWQHVLIRPGEHPLDELNRAGGEVGDESRVVLVVDQFEEVFTTCTDKPERDAFVASLVHAARDTRGRCIVVLAIRADQYERCAAYPDLLELLAATHVFVPPMRRAELREAVERPAMRVGLRVEPELTDALVADVEGAPGGLPLLSTALLELWQQRDGRRLRHAAYEHIGGVRGAVSRLAEDAFARLDPHDRAVARSTLPRLAAEGPDGTVERRRVPLTELETERSDAVGRVVNLFTERRLLTMDAGCVEVAHEALLREWPRLRGWIDADREGLRIHRAITEAAAEWRRVDRDEGALLQGSRLVEALEWCDSQAAVLNEHEREFIDASRARREGERLERRRRIRIAFAGLFFALAAISAVAIVALHQREQVEDQREEAEQQRDIAISQRLTAAAANALNADPALSLALALRAVESVPTAEAEAVLREATLQARTQAILRGHEGRVTSASFSPDGGLAVSSGVDGTVRTWDLGREQALQTIRAHDGPVYETAFSPDGKHIASAGEDGTVAMMDATGGARRVVLRTDGVALRNLDFSVEGDQLAVGAGDGTVYVLRAEAPHDIRRLRGHRARVTSLSFDDDGTRIVSGDQSGRLRVWDLESGTNRQAFAHRSGVVRAGFSPDGRAIVSSGGDARILTQDAATGATMGVLKDPDGVAFGVAMSPDGGNLIAGGPNGVLRIWDVSTRTEIAAMRGHRADIVDVGYDSAGDRVISAGDDGTVRVWAPPDTRVFKGPPGMFGARLSSDGRHLVAWGVGGIQLLDATDGTVAATVNRRPTSAAAMSRDGKLVIGGGDDFLRVWSTEADRPPLELRGHSQQINGVAFSPDGKRAASAGEDGQAIVWNVADGSRAAEMKLEGRVSTVDFSPDGDRVLTAGADGTARIWRADRSGSALNVLEGNGQELNGAAFSTDGRYVVAGAADGVVRIWRVSSGSSRALTGHVGQLFAVAVSTDDSRIASAGGDGTVRIWDVPTGRQLVTLVRHADGPALSVGFTPNGRQVLSAGLDNTIRITSCEVCGSLADTVELARTRRVD